MIDQTTKELLAHFAQGRELYKKRKFDEALTSFKRALTIKKDDGPSRLYASRCIFYQKNPPAVDWDGVFTFKTK